MVPYVKLGELSIVEITEANLWAISGQDIMTSFFVTCTSEILISKETLHHIAKLVKIKPMKKYYTVWSRAAFTIAVDCILFTVSFKSNSHIETPPLQVKGCKTKAYVIGAYSLWADNCLYHAITAITRDLGFQILTQNTTARSAAWNIITNQKQWRPIPINEV